METDFTAVRVNKKKVYKHGNKKTFKVGEVLLF